jgi:hypothetical protein
MKAFIHKAFNLEFLSAHAVRFVPVDLSLSDQTIGQAHSGNALELSPPSGALLLAQASDVANPTTCGDGFHAVDFSADREVHTCISSM